jgi:hypothetical protein
MRVTSLVDQAPGARHLTAAAARRAPLAPRHTEYHADVY